MKEVSGVKSVTLLGSPPPLRFSAEGDGVSIELPEVPEALRAQPAWVLKLGR